MFLAEIGSKIGNVEMNKKFVFDSKEFRQLNNLLFYNSLPEFDNEKPYIIVNEQKVMVGAILKRPLDIHPIPL